MSKLVTIARVLSLEEALVIQTLLQSAGIASIVGERHHAQVQWFAAFALGGLRVMAFASDFDDAVLLVDNASNEDGRAKGIARRFSERLKVVASAADLISLLLASLLLSPYAWWSSPGRKYRPDTAEPDSS